MPDEKVSARDLYSVREGIGYTSLGVVGFSIGAEVADEQLRLQHPYVESFRITVHLMGVLNLNLV
jgi:hypothetical protein